MSTASVKGSQGNRTMILLGILMIASVIAMVGVFSYIGRETVFDQERIGYTSEQQVLSQQIAKSALAASSGEEKAFDDLSTYRAQFVVTLDRLRNGNPETGLPPITEEDPFDAELSALEKEWKRFDAAVNTVLEGKETILLLSEAVSVISAQMEGLIDASESVVNTLVAKGASPRVISIASRQLMLAQRIVNNVASVLAGTSGVEGTEQFAADVEEFGTVLEGLIRGSKDIPKIKDKKVQDKLFDASMQFKVVSDYVGEILDNAEEILAVQDAAKQTAEISDAVHAASTRLHDAILAAAAARPVKAEHAYALGAIALVCLILLGWNMKRDAEKRAEAERQANERNQQAILRLLDEMSNLADGDLTSYATVTEDFTGAIADSINYTIDALRDVVTTINTTSEQVESAAEQTKATAMNLAEASEHQAQEITSAVTAINEMAVSISEVSENASETADLAQKSVEIANKGGKTVKRTIEGMDQIREHIQETSKRIKRLGESSQEIGDIVELINDIAEQTNILALNAAIQAAMAGEAGRGFAVVADEVQRLAERSSNATRQIEALVKTIQADTNEAVISMEQSTAGVVTGAQLAEDAGEALEEIVSVSQQVAEYVENISNSAAQQTRAAQEITATMNVIQEITTQTNAGTNETAASIGNLVELAKDLRKSVAGFKLPE